MRRLETIDRYHRRSYIIDLLFIALICCTGSIVTSGQEIITIKDRGTDNALLLYKDKPMFKTQLKNVGSIKTFGYGKFQTIPKRI